MNTIDPGNLLLQMRALAARTQGLDPAATQSAGGNFSTLFRQALDEVNGAQQTASTMATRFERGDTNTNIADVMIALQKADVSFQAATQVRNRLVSAYQEIMNMPI